MEKTRSPESFTTTEQTILGIMWRTAIGAEKFGDAVTPMMLVEVARRFLASDGRRENEAGLTEAEAAIYVHGDGLARLLGRVWTACPRDGDTRES